MAAILTGIFVLHFSVGNKCRIEGFSSITFEGHVSVQDGRDLMKHFGSQISVSSCSPSFPSEPPDIRNWFSSYEYESFMLDTNDIYADTSVECEDDKDRFVNEKTNRRKGYDWMKPGELRKRDEMNVNDDVSSYKFIKGNSFCEINKHEDLNLSKVPDALLSSSILSEPPDIRNWLSSYEYQSPVLDTVDCFNCSASNKSISEKEGVVGKCQGNKEKNLGDLRKCSDCHEEGSGQVDPPNATVLPKMVSMKAKF
ncbi:uncharacterized protein LOC110811460 isoform X2 [Carica papaya]|uniref:uncharacterized protein LOC110811460 isoform X2 n=1 Tax=Carica papaya TaxID=3649 RepID=UPI000B8CE035|nr:uncharacterized protein LOC110811460 isoform X2 [Carica papaya]